MSSQESTTNTGDSASTMDLPTQEVPDMYSDEELDNNPDVWGRLFPVGNSFTAVDLIKDTYSFGRHDECDYVFNSPDMKKHPCFQAYSKVHFKISKTQTSTGVHIFLEDKSSNGTFVNGERIGKNAKQVLNNNDEIQLSMKKNKAFVFLNLTVGDICNYPKALTSKYTITKELGRGACGEVRLAFEKGNCNKFAVKIISKKCFSMGGVTQVNTSTHIMKEVEIMKCLKHPGIIKIENVIDTKEAVFIILELVEGGELFDRIVSVGSFSEDRAKLYMYQIVLAINYLHKNGITHRDLKPENILLFDDNEDTVIKVTDFGLSKFIDAGSVLKTLCGTPNYLAPEILLTAGTGSYTKAVDCWSLGVIMFICLVGYPPFSEEVKNMDLQTQITGGHYSFPAQYWSGISDTAKDCVKRLMTVNPEKRMTIFDTLKHPWFKDEHMKKRNKEIMSKNHDVNNMGPPSSNRSPIKRTHEGKDGNSPPKKKIST